jgi:solute carrier family 25 2-oxodicarboxylate transporter 21
MAFFKGMESTLWRHGVWSGAYFGSINYIKSILKGSVDNQTSLSFISGVIGGTFGTLLNTPFDVVKTRVQNNIYRGNTLGGLVFIAKREGARALWKGFVPKVLRLGPGGGIMLVMFDAVSDWIRVNLM